MKKFSIKGRDIYLPLTISVFILFGVPAWSNASPEDYSIKPKTIEVVDKSGFQATLVNPSLEYDPYHYQNDLYGYWGVLLEGNPSKVKWIHFSQIKKVDVIELDQKLHVSVLLENEETIKGRNYPGPSLKIIGEGKLGRTTFYLNSIRSLKFLDFKDYGKEDAHLSREMASLKWSKQRTLTGKWEIIDGNTTTIGENLTIVDSSQTGGSRTEHFDWLSSLTFLQGAGEVTIPLKDIKVIEITPKTDRKIPEVTLQLVNGHNSTVRLKMEGLAGSNSPFQNDDFLAWRTAYGWEGISLLPARNIHLINIISNNN